MFSGELVRDKNRKWFFLIDNLLIYKGKKMKNENIVSKFDTIYEVFNDKYTQETAIEPCPIQIKKLFSYSQIKILINKFLPSLSYHCKGLVFYNLNTKYSNYSMLFPRNHLYHLQSNDEIEEIIRTKKPTLWSKTINKSIETQFEQIANDEISIIENTENISLDITKKSQIGENNMVFKVLHTDMPDVFNLYIYNEDKTELIKYDNALVPNMKTSKYLYKIFKNNKNSIDICMECRFSSIFKKWVPLRDVSIEPYTLDDIEKLTYE